MTVEERDVWIEVLHRPERPLVTVILSPSNNSGAGYGEYLSKRRSVLERGANLVEIDLLTGGQRMPLLRPPPRGDYCAFVIRHHRLPNVDVYVWGVRQPLPPLPIPLRPADPDVLLDLAAIFAAAFERGRYARALRYDEPLRVPLSPDDQPWATQLGRAMHDQHKP